MTDKPTLDEIRHIACDAMNAIGFSVSALEEIQKTGKWGGMQDVALKAAQDVVYRFHDVYDYLQAEKATPDIKRLQQEISRLQSRLAAQGRTYCGEFERGLSGNEDGV